LPLVKNKDLEPMMIQQRNFGVAARRHALPTLMICLITVVGFAIAYSKKSWSDFSVPISYSGDTWAVLAIIKTYQIGDAFPFRSLPNGAIGRPSKTH
jgi:hypothetical protein